MLKHHSSTRRLYKIIALTILTILSISATINANAAPDYVTIIIENDGSYPITFYPPSHVDNSDFSSDSEISTPRYVTNKDFVTGPTTLGAHSQLVLMMGLSKPLVNVFDILNKDWAFNLRFCQENGACEDARLNGTIASITSFSWTQSNNFSTSAYESITSEALQDYAKTKSTLAAALTFAGGALGLPFGSGGLIGSLPDMQDFKVTLKQACNARFNMKAEPGLAPDGALTVDLKINNIFPSTAINHADFAIDSRDIFSSGFQITENTCASGQQSQCVVKLKDKGSSNLINTDFKVTNHAGCSTGEKLAFSQGSFVLSNNVGFPVSYNLTINNRMFSRGEVWPGQVQDLRQAIGKAMSTVGDQECPQGMDPWIPGRRMGVCPMRLDVWGDGGPGVNGSVRCKLTMRQGTVGDSAADYMNLYSLTQCSPESPMSISPNKNFYQMSIKQIMPMSGMYKIVNIEMYRP